MDQHGTPWEPSPNGSVSAIAIAGPNVYVGGAFTTISALGGSTYHIARWNGTTWYKLGGSTALNSTVNAIEVAGQNVYVGGMFTDAGGDPNANYIARWDGSSWHALGEGLDSTVQAIAVAGPNVYVGGNFSFSVGWKC